MEKTEPWTTISEKWGIRKLKRKPESKNQSRDMDKGEIGTKGQNRRQK